MAFDEQLFIRALMDRPADAKKYCQTFDPMWLQTVELRPILHQLFEFTKKYTVPPSIDALREVFVDMDAKLYDIRYKPVIDKIAAKQLVTSDVLLCLDKAKAAAITLSLNSLTQTGEFTRLMDANDGHEVMREIRKWYAKFEGEHDSVELRIGEAVDRMIAERGWKNEKTEIPCGIEFIDDWCGGGLRPKQLGLVLAPTGHGKSVVLTVIAYKIALLCQKRVLYISNELAWEDCTARFGALIASTDIGSIVREPTVLREGNERMTNWGLNNNLWLWETTSEITADDIESRIKHYIDLYGWCPEVVVVDYMERMKPVQTGYARDATWNWYGAIAGDLVKLAKRNALLVWTAGQTNRSGMNNAVEQNMTQAQGSIRHLQECSAVIALRQRGDLKHDAEDVKILEFQALKMRHSKRADDSILVEADMGKLLITKHYHSKDEWAGTGDNDTDLDVNATNGGTKKNKGKKK